MKTVAKILAGSALAAMLVVSAFLGLGEIRFWALFGDPDLGSVEIETVERRTSPNDALACPAGFCRARADLTTADYAVPADALRAAFAKVVASERKIERVKTNEATTTERYIQRSETLGFPDTIVVRFADRPGGRSTLAIYSRSRFGESDFGANRARIERWLQKLATQVPPAP
jgi:uncharacterized protein (DUF1499 family)